MPEWEKLHIVGVFNTSALMDFDDAFVGCLRGLIRKLLLAEGRPFYDPAAVHWKYLRTMYRIGNT